MSHPATKKSSIFQIALNLTVATFLSGVVVAGVYFWTAPIAANQRILQRDASMKELVPGVTDFKPMTEPAGWFSASKDDKIVAYLIPGEGVGYGGKIRMLVAADPAGVLLGYKILAHNETPGLGDKTTQPKFKNQFVGKTVVNMEVTKTREAGKIDAITGVTISSRAVTKAVKESLIALGGYTSKQGSAP
jgi:electron transport complex protein RnfG